MFTFRTSITFAVMVRLRLGRTADLDSVPDLGRSNQTSGICLHGRGEREGLRAPSEPSVRDRLTRSCAVDQFHPSRF